MASNKRAIKASARRFYDAVETAATALEELISFRDEDVFEDIAEDLLEDSHDGDTIIRRAWLEQVAAFALLQAVKLDLAEEEGEEEEEGEGKA
ncbi:MAG: hypothetical protein WCF85_14155 [Rhodospirillaceae bacterium]